MESLAYLRQKMIRPPEGRCPTTKCLMVILKSTAAASLPLNLGVEVKTVLLIYFERRARRFHLEFPRTPKYSTFVNQRPFVLERAGVRRGAE